MKTLKNIKEKPPVKIKDRVKNLKKQTYGFNALLD